MYPKTFYSPNNFFFNKKKIKKKKIGLWKHKNLNFYNWKYLNFEKTQKLKFWEKEEEKIELWHHSTLIYEKNSNQIVTEPKFWQTQIIKLRQN